jgi:lipoteichoic acid synthase
MAHFKSFLRTPFFLFTNILLLKYLIMQIAVFNNLNLIDTIYIALPAFLFFFLPIEILVRKNKMQTYLAFNALFSALMICIMIYSKQFGIIVTYHAFSQAKQVIDVGNSIMNLMQPLYILFVLDFLAYLVFRRFKFNVQFSISTNSIKPLLGLWAVSLAIIIILVITSDDLLSEKKQAERMGVVTYQFHVFFSDFFNTTKAAQMEKITPESIRQIKKVAVPFEPVDHAVARGKNLIIVQLESFQNFLVGMKINDQEITPTLNRLMNESYYFTNFYQNIGQGNTADAEFIVNTSFYPPAQQAASQVYENKLLPSLPRLLRQLGYEAITLHTNDVEFWNRNQLYPALGFNKYYDKSWFGEEDMIAFGASDEVLYLKTTPVLKEFQLQGTPFYAHMIAQSSHHPFTPPETKKLLALPEQWQDTNIGNYMIMANYADLALGEFIEQLKQEGLWEDAVFVVYGDHFGISTTYLSAEEKVLLEEQLGYEYNLRTTHNVPLFITIPGYIHAGKTFNHLGGQIDLMPTIANLLGISLLNHVHFGQDLLNHRDNIVSSRYYLPNGSFLNDEMMYISGETFGDGVVIPLSTHPSSNLILDPLNYRDDFERMMHLYRMNDIYVESLPER